MRTFLILLLTVPFIAVGQNSDNYQKMGLAELNEFLFSEYVLNKNTQPLSDVATEDYVFVAAPGMIENKKQAIDGVENLDISFLNVTVDKIVGTENIGIVVGILEMKGTIMHRPVPGKVRYTSTFIKEEGRWKLKMRTMTPIRM